MESAGAGIWDGGRDEDADGGEGVAGHATSLAASSGSARAMRQSMT